MSIPLFPNAEIAHQAVMMDKLHRVLHSYDGDRQRWLVHVTTAHGAGTFSLVQWRRACQCIPHGTEEIPARVLEFHPRVDGVFEMKGDCFECFQGSKPVALEGWGMVHADEGCPAPVRCPDGDVDRIRKWADFEGDAVVASTEGEVLNSLDDDATGVVG